ncbi:SDR family NAD(P)-dependent oxidoreductase [Xylanimonas ulmi]|uniref:NADP-dependent 3-hydroxy acid dehydrogenase YdfG n=1 Tax=Xylanimonas ulmi TaxID=228973 RepID=A0A4Q7M4V1_9MICO|nr:SDR family NAD(P)-dependent oxidoreductase [Xylanibacterium ulmi]RZS61029.1 NADP-dependent 3-hydroxy acid dehydrogenase YdfG [Xylanibacterium ulmi]
MTSRRRALVTGASRGFGAACVEVFAGAGWDVVAASRAPRSGALAGVVNAIWDVTDDDGSALRVALGSAPLDLVVNNAGVGMPGTPLEGLDVTAMLGVLDVNVGGVLRTTRVALPNLRLARSPLVLNITSRLGSIHDQAVGRYRGFGTSYGYRISKAAQNMATVALAQELGPDVRVWAVHPGSLATGMGRSGAGGDPVDAARELLRLAASPEPTSPRFLNLGGGDLPW